MATLRLTPSALGSSSRALAPDLARGFMLLLIALANTPWYLYGSSTGTSSIHATDGSTLDRAVQFVIITAVDSRVYPMFAFLFGYGIVQMYQRSLDRGAEPRAVRRVLRRRHLWMIVIGAVHAALLWMGDIVGAYGLVGLIFTAAFLKRRDKTLLIWAGVLTGLLTLAAIAAITGSVFAAQSPPPPEADVFLDDVKGVNGIASWPASILPRLTIWAFLLAVQGLLTLVIPIAVLLAFWTARHRIMEEPDRHRRLLTITAALGITVAWGGGAVHALQHLGVLLVPEHVSWVFSATQPLTRAAGRPRLRRAVRTDPGRARAAGPDRRPDGQCDQRGRQAVLVGVPGPVGHLRPVAVCLGPGSRCCPRQRRRGRSGDRWLVGHGPGVLAAGTTRAARTGRVAAGSGSRTDGLRIRDQLCGDAPSAGALHAF
ncbi:MAG TPA: hypothetical protein VM428_14470 [Microlunatus sp.]|nr:hypothetical protein [Microlunatus sp.]